MGTNRLNLGPTGSVSRSDLVQVVKGIRDEVKEMLLAAVAEMKSLLAESESSHAIVLGKSLDRQLGLRDKGMVEAFEKRLREEVAARVKAIADVYERKFMEVQEQSAEQAGFLKETFESTLSRMVAVVEGIQGMRPPDIHVHTPEQPAPIVNVEAAQVTLPAMQVHLPEQPAPVINNAAPVIHLPEQPAAVINLPPMQVAIPPQKPVKKTFSYYPDGRPESVTEQPLEDR